MLTTRFSVHLLFYSCRQTLVKALQSSVAACSCIFTFVLFNFFLRRIVVGGGDKPFKVYLQIQKSRPGFIGVRITLQKYT